MKKSKRGIITILSIGVFLFGSILGNRILNNTDIAVAEEYNDNEIIEAHIKEYIDNIIIEQFNLINDEYIKLEEQKRIFLEKEHERQLAEEEEAIRLEEIARKEREEEERLIALAKKEQERKIQDNTTVSRGSNDRTLYTVTCYDLSVQSTGKKIGNKWHGITANGTDLKGHTWETARAIAVDPRKIPLGSKVEITFTNEKYSKYNGVYTAVDVGGAIKGNKIDFFLGDFGQNETHPSVWEFGRTQAVIKILE